MMCRRGLSLLLTMIMALSISVPVFANEEADQNIMPIGGVTMSITGAMTGIEDVSYYAVDGTYPAVRAWEADAFPTQYTGVLPGGEVVIWLKPEYKLTVENGQIIEDTYFFDTGVSARKINLRAPSSGTMNVCIALSGEVLPQRIPMTEYVKDDALLVANLRVGGKMGPDWITTGAEVILQLKSGYTAEVLTGGQVKNVGAYYYPTTIADSVSITLEVDQNASEFIFAVVKDNEHFLLSDETTVESQSKTGHSATFSDVAKDSWYYSSVEQAYSKGIVAGTSLDIFSPNSLATRGQAVIMLYRAMGSPATETSFFTDVSGNELVNAASWAASKDIVAGVTDTTFDPNSAITREQLVTMLYRLAGSPVADSSLASYIDSNSVQSYATDAMTWAAQNSIIVGYGDGSIRPTSYATRAEVCAILIRFMEKSM